MTDNHYIAAAAMVKEAASRLDKYYKSLSTAKRRDLLSQLVHDNNVNDVRRANPGMMDLAKKVRKGEITTDRARAMIRSHVTDTGDSLLNKPSVDVRRSRAEGYEFDTWQNSKNPVFRNKRLRKQIEDGDKPDVLYGVKPSEEILEKWAPNHLQKTLLRETTHGRGVNVNVKHHGGYNYLKRLQAGANPGIVDNRVMVDRSVKFDGIQVTHGMTGVPAKSFYSAKDIEAGVRRGYDRPGVLTGTVNADHLNKHMGVEMDKDISGYLKAEGIRRMENMKIVNGNTPKTYQQRPDG